jgi:hypothetical protein
MPTTTLIDSHSLLEDEHGSSGASSPETFSSNGCFFLNNSKI